MPLVLRSSRRTESNALQRAQIQIESYHDDPLFNSFFHPDVPLDVKLAFFMKMLSKDMNKPGVVNLEVVDTDLE